jgi:AraC family transcriptional regulator
MDTGPYRAAFVNSATIAGLRFTQLAYPPRLRLPRHHHAGPYLCLVAAGRFEERTLRRREVCSTGTVIWNPNGEHDDLFGDAGARCWNIEFSGAWQERLALAADAWTRAGGDQASWLAVHIMRELLALDGTSSLTLEGLVCALIGAISHPATDDARRPVWVRRARERLHADFLQPPSVAELARDAGVHRSHFARTFRRHVGCTVADYVKRCRVEYAADQLRHHGVALADLSLRAGFGDQAHFTRAFKQVTGVTPGAFRATLR